jgi:hypothetical protein
VPNYDPAVGTNGFESWNNVLGGLWIKPAGTSVFSQALQGTIGYPGVDAQSVNNFGQDYRQYWACQIEYVPNCPGEMLYTPHADFSNDKFYWLVEDLTTHAVTVNEPDTLIRNVRKFGFTLNPNGGSRPAVGFVGDYNGVTGEYLSLDWFATPPLLIGGRYPARDISGGMRTFGGDMTTFCRFGTTPDGKGSVVSKCQDIAHAG